MKLKIDGSRLRKKIVLGLSAVLIIAGGSGSRSCQDRFCDPGLYGDS